MERRKDGKMEGWKNGQADPNSQDPSSHSQGFIKDNCSGPHLKVKDTEKDTGLTKKNHITISKQKICSIQKIILTIQQILQSHELKGHAYF